MVTPRHRKTVEGGQLTSTGRQRWSGCRGHPSTSLRGEARLSEVVCPETYERVEWITGLLGQEAGGLWTRIAGERKRFRQNVVWQSYSARREECHGAIKKFDVLKPPKVVVLVHFAM